MVAQQAKLVAQNGLTGLARHLVARKLINVDTALEVHKNAEKEKNAFFVQAVKQNVVPALTLCDIASREFGIPFFDLDALDLEKSGRFFGHDGQEVPW